MSFKSTLALRRTKFRIIPREAAREYVVSNVVRWGRKGTPVENYITHTSPTSSIGT